MATVDWGVLNEGFVADSVGAIFTATAQSWVKMVTLHNTNAAEQTAFLYLTKSGGTRRKIARYVLAQHESACWDKEIALAIGDAIEAVTTTASAVDHTVSGGFKV